MIIPPVLVALEPAPLVSASFLPLEPAPLEPAPLEPAPLEPAPLEALELSPLLPLELVESPSVAPASLVSAFEATLPALPPRASAPASPPSDSWSPLPAQVSSWTHCGMLTSERHAEGATAIKSRRGESIRSDGQRRGARRACFCVSSCGLASAICSNDASTPSSSHSFSHIQPRFGTGMTRMRKNNHLRLLSAGARGPRHFESVSSLAQSR